MSKNILQYAMGLLIIAFLWCVQDASALVTEIDSDIKTETTWIKEDSPYVIKRDVYVDAPLTIDPGVIVKFDYNVGADLIVRSELNVIGDKNDHIIFTSIRDDSFGGDTNNDGNLTVPKPGDWSEIRFQVGSIGTMEYVSVLYAVGLNSVRGAITIIGTNDVAIRNTEIRYSGYAGILLSDSSPIIEKNIISNNGVGVMLFGGKKAVMTYNIIADNRGGASVMGTPTSFDQLDARNNWWGDISGPYYERGFYGGVEQENLDGKGNRVNYGVRFDPWLDKEPTDEDVGCQENCYSSVLFLPGLKASRLYDKLESTCPYDADNKELVWEPNCNEDVRGLYLDSDGKSISSDIYVKEGDVIDETPIGSNIYKSFIEKMDSMKNAEGLINDWKAASYDWRLSLDDILADDSIEGKLRDLAANSKSGKVTIVAHSNGGLLTKALMIKLGDEEVKKLVDKIIFVAVPQVGTPAAMAGLLHAEDQGLFPVLSMKNARAFGENMAGAYNLLPSEKYFSSVQTPVASFDIDSDSDFKDRYSNNIDLYNEFYNFLIDDFHRVSATCSEMDIPIGLNWKLLEKSKSVHEDLDNWTAPEGINVIQIAGWGVLGTLSKAEYTNKKEDYCDEGICVSGMDTLDPDFKFTIDGDGTVVTPSALWMSEERYWVDIAKYNSPLNRIGTLRLFGTDHADILEIPELNSFVADNIANNLKPIEEYKYVTTEVPPSSDEKRLEYSLHSPLTLELYDDQGRHTGINSSGQIEEQIPGTYYKQFGDVKYIFANEDISSHIKMNGYDEGVFTFEVKEFIGDEEINKVTFKDMPTTPETRVAFAVPSDLENASSLEIDKNGDGTIDFSLEPKIGEIVILDTTAPVTNNSLEGKLGDNSWHTTDVKFSLSATDEAGGSGVAKTYYSLDGGETLIEYLNQIIFDQEGVFEVEYYSIDKQGNVEEKRKTTIKIDKAAPEVKLTFDVTAKKLDILGMDNLSSAVSVTTTEEEITDSKSLNNKKNKLFWFLDKFKNQSKNKITVTATLIDEAGHKTEIIWEKKKDKNNRVDISIASISYNGNILPINTGILQYKWAQNWKKKYLFFASHINTDSMRLESHYFAKKNETWLMEKPMEIVDDESDDEFTRRPAWKKMQGMIIPSIMTDAGKLKINY